jgi:putative peptidoglycan lipid II flippase
MRQKALDSFLVSGLSAAALAATLVLYRLVTNRFSPTDTDAFFLAFGVLSVITGPIYNAISSTLVPRLVRSVRDKGVGDLLGPTLWWTMCGSVAATLIVAAFAVEGLGVFGTVLAASTAKLVRLNILVLGPLVVVQAVGAVLGAANQAAGRYWVPVAAGVCQQVLTAVLVGVGLPVATDLRLPLAFTLGAIGYLAFLIGASPWKRLNIYSSLRVPGELKTATRLALPLILGTAALQIGVVGLRLFAARTPGAVTAFDLAYRISSALVEVTSSGVLAVALTEWSVAVMDNQTASLRARLRDTLALALFVVLPFPVVLHSLREPLVRMWLSSHAVDPAVATLTIAALGVLLIGVPFDIAGRLYVRVLLAQGRTTVLGWLSLQRMVLTLMLASIVGISLGVSGLALSDTLAVIVTALSLHHAATGSWGSIRAVRTNGGLARAVLAGIVSWCAATVVFSGLTGLPSWMRCGLGAAAALVCYIGLAHFTKSPELAAVVTLFRGTQGVTNQSRPPLGA